MTADWPVMTLGDVCLKITDGAHNSPKSVASGKPMASVKDLTRFGVDLSDARHISLDDYEALVRQGCRPEVGDVLIAKDGNSALDTVCNVKQPLDAVLLSSVAILRPDPNIVDSDFLKFFLSSKETIDYLKGNFISGAAIPRVVLKDFKKAKIKLPPLDMQKDMVAILNSVEGKIELNRQINQTLEQIAQAIFKSWFVDFEPVKAKIEAKQNGQDPERAAMCAISGKPEADLVQLTPAQLSQLAAIAVLFPDELTDSELGLIPKGWVVKKIIEWGNVICGKTPPKIDPSNYDGQVPFVKIPDMHGNVFATTTNDTLSQKGASTQPRKQFPKGSVCVSCIATVGQVVLASEDSHTNQQINTIVPEIMRHNYYLFFSMTERTNLLHELASGGSATLNLNTGNFSKIPLLFPGELLLDGYYQKVDSFFCSILVNDRQSQVLSSIRDILLPKFLSGKI